MASFLDLKRDLGEVVIDFFLVTLSIVLRGIVLSYMWLWFIVPLGVPGIGILHALGVSMIVSFLTFNPFVKHEYHPKATKTILSLAVPLIVFVFGYLYHFGV